MSLTPPPKSTTDDHLLARIREGDRDAAALFVARYQGQIRRRMSGKLRRLNEDVTDTDELFSTMLRRIDQAVMQENIRAQTVGELMKYIITVSDNAQIEPTRRRQERRDKVMRDIALDLLPEKADRQAISSAELYDLLAQTAADDADHELIRLWLNGHPFQHIAAMLNMKLDTAKKRWLRLKERVRLKWDNRDV